MYASLKVQHEQTPPFDTHHKITLVLALSFGPKMANRIGIGAIPKAINPNSEFPHPKPNASYKSSPTRGTKAPRTDHKTALAAVTDAAWSGNASTR